MIDVESNARMTVRTEGPAGPFLFVPLPQMPEVEALLTAAKIRFSRSRDAVQSHGYGPVVMIDFGRRADPVEIQAVLDGR